jgi:hypothetical protein
MSVSLILLEFVKTQKVVVKGDWSMCGFKDHISLLSFSWGIKAKTRIENQKPKTTVKLDMLRISK